MDHAATHAGFATATNLRWFDRSEPIIPLIAGSLNTFALMCGVFAMGAILPKFSNAFRDLGVQVSAPLRALLRISDGLTAITAVCLVCAACGLIWGCVVLGCRSATRRAAIGALLAILAAQVVIMFVGWVSLLLALHSITNRAVAGS